MVRIARLTSPGWVYHVTQRGNRRGPVFFDREDRESYLDSLSRAAERHGAEIWAYCLMTNHVHHMVKGHGEDSLGDTFREVQGGHALRINRRFGWSGHLWAQRFFSCPVTESSLWATVRYIERNPVRAGLVPRSEDYPWSSAAAHCGLSTPRWLAPTRPFPGGLDWSTFLAVEDPSADERLRIASRTGRTLIGGQSPISELETS
jgi:putative transposase